MVISGSTCQKEEKECIWIKYLIYVVLRAFNFFLVIYALFPQNSNSQIFRVSKKIVNYKSAGWYFLTGQELMGLHSLRPRAQLEPASIIIEAFIVKKTPNSPLSVRYIFIYFLFFYEGSYSFWSKFQLCFFLLFFSS